MAEEEPEVAPDLNGPCPNLHPGGNTSWTIRILPGHTPDNPAYICYPACGLNERTIVARDGQESRSQLAQC